MVQAPRLDLIRVAVAVAVVVVLTAAASSAASAQPLAPASPLLQDGPLTTLLQPQKLDRSRPLLPQAGEGTGSADSTPGRTTPCTRQGKAAGPAPLVLGGGSGPGDYGRYLPTPPSSAAAPTAALRSGSTSSPVGTAPPTRTPGVDRPLWDTGDRRATTAGKPAPSSDADKAAGATASPAPAPARDRPLWADGSLLPSAESASIPTPCIDQAPTTPR